MIKITTNFDHRKFMRELERKAMASAETKIREKLRDLTARGLKIKGNTGASSDFRMELEGPVELIEEAKRRLG